MSDWMIGMAHQGLIVRSVQALENMTNIFSDRGGVAAILGLCFYSDQFGNFDFLPK